MKFIFFFGSLMISFLSQAQHDIHTTTTVSIEGKVKKAITFSLTDLIQYKTVALDSLIIYNHLMEQKKVIRNMKGVLLKDILMIAEIEVPSPKLLSEFYFICIAADGYKVVFSWNEIFNSETGNHLMIITQEDGKKAEDMNDHIAILCPKDIATGRRYVQGLEKIIIERAN